MKIYNPKKVKITFMGEEIKSLPDQFFVRPLENIYAPIWIQIYGRTKTLPGEFPIKTGRGGRRGRKLRNRAKHAHNSGPGVLSCKGWDW